MTGASQPSRRIGLLGGAFNPPHLGHLRLAELAWSHLELDGLRFIPSAQSPHKSEPVDGPEPESRLRMLHEALVGTAFSVETMELDKGGTSYSVDTLEALRDREPGLSWIWILGSDQAAAFTSWRRWERILELASLAVAPRPEWNSMIPESLASRVRDRWSGGPGEWIWLPSTDLALSSSRLRTELAAGSEPPGLTAQVRAAIRRENLYR